MSFTFLKQKWDLLAKAVPEFICGIWDVCKSCVLWPCVVYIVDCKTKSEIQGQLNQVMWLKTDSIILTANVIYNKI